MRHHFFRHFAENGNFSDFLPKNGTTTTNHPEINPNNDPRGGYEHFENTYATLGDTDFYKPTCRVTIGTNCDLRYEP